VSDQYIVRPIARITSRLLLTVLLLGTIGHLSIELEYRLVSPVVQARASNPRGFSVRALAHARKLLRLAPSQGEAALIGLIRTTPDPQIAHTAAQSLAEQAASEWPSGRRGRFLRAVAAPAILTGKTHRIPPSITIAQAIHESGWGRSSLARKNHNLFGMKATTAQAGVSYPTLEYTESGVRVERARFRVFSSHAESLQEHARLLAHSPRYAAARPHAQSWPAYLSAIAPTYATDPRYPRQITLLIERYGLDRWDAVVGREPNPERPA
jgi:hypothetical protein